MPVTARRPLWIWKPRAMSPMPCTSAAAATHATKTTTEEYHDPAAQKPKPSSMNPQINSTHHPDTTFAAKAVTMSMQPRTMK
jgi:hypothetical protein